MKKLMGYFFLLTWIVLSGCSANSTDIHAITTNNNSTTISSIGTTSTTNTTVVSTTTTAIKNYAYRNCFIAIKSSNAISTGMGEDELYFGSDAGNFQKISEATRAFGTGGVGNIDIYYLYSYKMESVPGGLYINQYFDRFFLDTNTCEVTPLDLGKQYVFPGSGVIDVSDNVLSQSTTLDISNFNDDRTKFVFDSSFYDKATGTQISLEDHYNYYLNQAGTKILGNKNSEYKLIEYNTDDLNHPVYIENVEFGLKIAGPYFIYDDLYNMNDLYLFNLDTGTTQKIADDYEYTSIPYSIAFLEGSNELLYKTVDHSVKVLDLSDNTVIKTINNINKIYPNRNVDTAAVLLGDNQVIWYQNGESLKTQSISSGLPNSTPIITTEMVLFKEGPIIMKNTGLYTSDPIENNLSVAYVMDDDAIYVSFSNQDSPASSYIITPDGITSLNWIHNIVK